VVVSTVMLLTGLKYGSSPPGAEPPNTNTQKGQTMKLWHVVYKGERNTAPEEVRAERLWFEDGWAVFGARQPGSAAYVMEVAVNRDELSSITEVNESS